jgi:peroxiredoxin
MKALFLSLLFAAFITGTYAQQVNITGNASSFKDGDTLKLFKWHPKRLPAEVPLIAVIQNGSFKFSLSQPAPEIYILQYHLNKKSFFLDAGNVQINIADTALRKSELKGSTATNDDYEAFSKIMNENKNISGFYSARKNAILAAGGTMNSPIYAKAQPKLDSLLELSKQDQVTIAVAWVKAHPNSQINSLILTQHTTGSSHVDGLLPSDQLRSIFNALPDTVKKNSWGKELQYQLNNLLIGSTAPDFAEVNPDGKLIKLSDFKGRYVLLDFWASWCKPCRAETPNVTAAYQQYKAHNFEILSVSLDINKADWIRAIKHDGMPWAHVCDPHHATHWDSRVAKLYYVSLVPANFLIDPNGVIIAKDLHGDELQDTLKKLLK